MSNELQTAKPEVPKLPTSSPKAQPNPNSTNTKNAGMLASRTTVSLHHRIVAGGQRRRCVGRSERKPQGRHFTQALESLWRHSPRIPPLPAAAATGGDAKSSWQSPVLENAAFEEYYKVRYLFQFT